MNALPGTLGPDSVDVVVDIPVGNSFAYLIGGLVRSLTQTGAAIADEQDMLDFGEVFNCHVECV